MKITISSNHLDLANTSTVLDAGRVGDAGTGDRLALEVAQESSVGSAESTAGTEGVQLASVAQVGAADCVGASAGGTEEGSLVTQQGSGHVLKDVALSDDHTALCVVESVSSVVVEHVVDGVHQAVTTDLGRAAAGGVDVVALHGDEIRRAGQVDGPVVAVVASGGPLGVSVEVVVREGDTVGSSVSSDEHLATDQGDLAVVDPYEVRAVNSDGITTPDVLRVELRDVDVLDDDVLGAVGNSETLSAKDTLGANADNALVGAYSETADTSLVVSHRDALDASASISVRAPTGMVDSILAYNKKETSVKLTCFRPDHDDLPPLPGHLLLAGRQPVSVAVPSVPLKLNSLSRTMQRAVLSASHSFNCAVPEGTTQAAEPPPVVPVPKPSGLPTTA